MSFLASGTSLASMILATLRSGLMKSSKVISSLEVHSLKVRYCHQLVESSSWLFSLLSSVMASMFLSSILAIMCLNLLILFSYWSLYLIHDVIFSQIAPLFFL